MSFFQNLHLNPSTPNNHTIRTTRSYRKNQGHGSPLHIYQLQQQQQQGFNDPSYNNNNSNVQSHKDIRIYAESTLGSGSVLAQAVKLPKDEDANEWIAVHVVDFYNQINMLYGSITEFCSPKTCPRMIATPEYEYLWQDSLTKRPISLSAPDYVENLMKWIQNFFDDDNVFPSKIGTPFPPQFQTLVKTMLKRLFRVYAHVYCHHFDEITELGLQTHLNTSLKHFVLFCKEFQLIQEKDYGPLAELVQAMLDDDKKGFQELK